MPDLFTEICKIPIKRVKHVFDGYFAFSPFKCTKRASALVQLNCQTKPYERRGLYIENFTGNGIQFQQKYFNMADCKKQLERI